MLGENLAPEYHVVTGVRRTRRSRRILESRRHRDYRGRHRQEPLVCILGCPARDPVSDAARRARRGSQSSPGGPRTERDSAGRRDLQCHVLPGADDGASLEVSYPGLTLGSFARELRFTVYRGTNLIRMDAVAKTSEKWVVKKYDAGLGGFSTALTPRVTWRDTGGHPQRYAFGGVTNHSMVPLRAANRVLVAAGKTGSLAVFTPPHTYFFTREVDTNLATSGTQRRRGPLSRSASARPSVRRCNKTSTTSHCSTHRPARNSEWASTSTRAPSGPSDTAVRARLHHGDTFKPVNGYKTMVNHFHLRFTERVRATKPSTRPYRTLPR